MAATKRKKGIGWRLPLLAVVIALVALVIVGVLYVKDYYKADVEAIDAFAENASVDYKILDDGTVVYAPEGATRGLIFYPGGKVEYTAYMPLMQACAEKGILCVLLKMPLNLAVLDMDGAAKIPEQYPQISQWYLGGHSLGGAMAANYLAKHTQEYAGLVLLGAYSTKDLSDTELQVLSVYGSEDLVINRQKYIDKLENLPADYTQVIIDGGCHAGFGMYGAQEGDGTPQIDAATQIRQTAEAVAAMILQ